MKILIALLVMSMATAAEAVAQQCDLLWAARNSGLATLDFLIPLSGILLIVAGLAYAGREIIERLLKNGQVALEIAGYVLSAALAFPVVWIPASGLEFYASTMPVGGCLLFMGTVFGTINIHKIKGEDPTMLALIFTVVWSIVAIVNDNTFCAGLAAIAAMNLLGFNVVVGTLSYGFGFAENETGSVAARATLSAIMLGTLALVQQVWYPSAPRWVAIFGPGTLFATTFVASTGLLIMASSWVSFLQDGKISARFILLNIVASIWYSAVIVAGLVLLPGSSLLSTGYIFMALYIAAKPGDFRPKHRLAMSIALTVAGSTLYASYAFRDIVLDRAKTYISQLPKAL